MSFTYDVTTAAGQVRLLIPDKDVTAYELDDAEIDYFLTQRGNNALAAAVDACKWLARKYAQTPTFSADGLTFNGSERARVYAERAVELQTQLSGGGLSIASITKEDGYSEASGDSDYDSRIVYVRTS